MSELKVVTLVPKTNSGDAESHATAIKFLEDALERAKTENVLHAIVIMQLPDNAILDGWSDGINIRPYVMVGALEEVKHRYMTSNIEQR